ncbi:MAG: branched-chain amino acid transaminase [Candidatus Dormibacterales bacterium]
MTAAAVPETGPGPGGVAYFEGAFVPLAEARIPITTHAFNYGTGCFEGVRAYWNQERGQLYALRLKEHVLRLAASARILKLDLAEDPATLEGILVELLARNGYRQDAYVRPLVYKAEATIKVALTGLATRFCAYTIPMGEYLALDRGLELTVSAWRRIEDNAIPARAKPTGAYVNAALASDEARTQGFDEALMLTSEGHVAEASSANLFLVRSGTLVTPPETDDVLVGVTRLSILQLAASMGVPSLVRSVDRSEIFDSDEAFLCGTGVQVAAVTRVDGRLIGEGVPGELTRRLQIAYLDVARGVSPEFQEWRTPVYPE